MTKVILLSQFVTFLCSLIKDHPSVSIRKDYECEILERDYFMKDCYRNADLNFEGKKMIASTLSARGDFYWLD